MRSRPTGGRDLHPDTYFAIDSALGWDRGTARSYAAGRPELRLLEPLDPDQTVSHITAQMVALDQRLAAIEHSPPWFPEAIDVLRDLAVSERELVMEFARMIRDRRRRP